MVAWSWGIPFRAHMHAGVGPTPELTCPHPSRHVGPTDPGGLGIQPLLLPSLTIQLSPSIRLHWLQYIAVFDAEASFTIVTLKWCLDTNKKINYETH